MIIKSFSVGPFPMNTYVLSQEGGKECLLIDPSDDLHVIHNYLDESNLKPIAIVNTHAHIDHIRFTSDIQKKYELPFYLSEEEVPLLENLQQQGAMFGMETAEPPKITHFLQENMNFKVGSFEFSVIHAPGHSPGSMCFLFGQDLIGGDVLFFDSIGRTEFGYDDKLVSCCASLSYGDVYDITFRVYNLVRSNLIIGHKIKPLMEKELKRQEALALGQQMLDNPENFGLV